MSFHSNKLFTCTKLGSIVVIVTNPMFIQPWESWLVHNLHVEVAALTVLSSEKNLQYRNAYHRTRSLPDASLWWDNSESPYFGSPIPLVNNRRHACKSLHCSNHSYGTMLIEKMGRTTLNHKSPSHVDGWMSNVYVYTRFTKSLYQTALYTW